MPCVARLTADRTPRVAQTRHACSVSQRRQWSVSSVASSISAQPSALVILHASVASVLHASVVYQSSPTPIAAAQHLSINAASVSQSSCRIARTRCMWRCTVAPHACRSPPAPSGIGPRRRESITTLTLRLHALDHARRGSALPDGTPRHTEHSLPEIPPEMHGDTAEARIWTAAAPASH